ncbi:unnamed protein product [Blepharisma stoltei]|uniref:RNA methyltransferase n=1 Tax=Blepharisma stoltei TaxID=1481888 RepID=A0AAU9IMS6_9CILI|nr:unnamed protein product [Blepharisma stoltei]
MNKRLCWQGIDKWISEKKLARILKDNLPSIDGLLLARPPKKPYAFLEFDTEERMNTFVEAFQPEIVNKKYKFKQATDRAIGKGKSIEEILLSKPPKVTIEAQPLGPIEDKVTPYWNMQYSAQLLEKKNQVSKFYGTFLKDMEIKTKKSDTVPLQWLSEPPQVLDVKSSPATEGYRNKVEYTIGYAENREIKVGFTNGQMAAGNLRVDSPENCINISQFSKDIAVKVEECVKASGIPPVDTKTNEGVWKTVLLRTTTYTNQSMLVLTVNDNHQISKIEQALQPLSSEVDTLVLVVQKSPRQIKVLSGSGFITERLLNKTFQISPLSFFQVNTSGCEILYTEVMNSIEGELLLDICCGTGSIGICCSDKVKRIIGIEIVPEAVEDAIINAQMNNVSAEYKVGKAEDLMKDISREVEGQVITGVVDPPRNGLHKNILTALRTTKGLDNLVYVSCNPETMFKDLVQLCAPESGKKFRAPPFVPLRVQPVDMFPHTPHVECVVALKRITKL